MLNPVIERELKTKMRRWKAPALLAFYLSTLAFVFLFQTTAFDNYLMSGGYEQFSPARMLSIYNALSFFQLVLILFILPALTAGGINGERERQTLDLMLCTTFSTYAIINGKMIASILHILWLLFASMPIFGIALLYGGVDGIDLLKLMTFYVSIAILYSSAGTFFSVVFKKSKVSTVIAYIFVLIMTFGTLFVFGILLAYYNQTMLTQTDMTGGFEQMLAERFLFVNPLFALNDILPNGNSGGILNFFWFGAANAVTEPPFYLTFYAKTLYFNTAATLIFYVFAAERLKPIKKSILNRTQ